MTEQERGRRWSAVLAERDRLLRISRARTVCEADAEDCVQEAMLRCVEFADLDEARIPAFLTTVTLRLCADSHRARARLARAGARVAAAPEPSPEEPICDRAEAAWLADRLATMPDRQRRIVEARAAEPSCAAVADRLGVSVDAVKSALARARRSARAALAGTAALLLPWLRRPRAGALALGGTSVALVALVAVLPGADLGSRPPAAPAARPPVGFRDAAAPAARPKPPAAPVRRPAARPTPAPAAAAPAPPRDDPAPDPEPVPPVPTPSVSVGPDPDHDRYGTVERWQHCLTYGVQVVPVVECKRPPGPSPDGGSR